MFPCAGNTPYEDGGPSSLMWIMAHGKGRVSSVSHNVRCKVDLPLIRELLTDEEYAELLRRMVLPNGPLLDYNQAFGVASTA